MQSQPKNSEEGVCVNLTFFTGAGFSKSWDNRFPVGDVLFSFTHKEWNKHGTVLREFLTLNNYPTDVDLTASIFKDIVYQIGMMRKYPAIRPRYIDDQNLDMVERHLRYLVLEKFKQIAPLYYETDEKLQFDLPPNAQQLEILKFFRVLNKLGDGSSGVPEGIRASYVSTNYDFTLEAILDACLEVDDPYSLYTYRGITPSKYSGRNPYTVIHDNWLVNNLFKINGGFEIFKSGSTFEFDYSKRSDAQLRAEPPQLMLASREQDYTQSYFHAMFPKIIRLLQETHILVIVGYSLPEEDALIRLIIKQFAEDRADGDQKILFYVDMIDEGIQLKKVNNVVPHVGSIRGLRVLPYSGSFSKWCTDVTNELKGKI